LTCGKDSYMMQRDFIIIGAMIMVLIIVYMIMRHRTDKIRSTRNNRTRFRRDQ